MTDSSWAQPQAAAIISTISKSCRRRGIDPFAYRRDVFARPPSMTNWQIKELTPQAWAKGQQRAGRRAAA